MAIEKEIGDEINILFNILKKHVKEKFDLEVKSSSELRRSSRKRPMVYFRKMMMILLGEAFSKDYNQDEIASIVGLDRTSFIYHFKTHLNEYKNYNDYKQEYDEIRDSFFEKIGI
jgi:hypothetical protein